VIVLSGCGEMSRLPAGADTGLDPIARDLYGVDLILLRPDLHVAWHGNQLPA
jgi:hypothetical protein